MSEIVQPRIIDASLREGAQAPGVRFSAADSAAIAAALTKIGVDMIECGHPAAGPDEAARVDAARASTDRPVLVHARADLGDVRAAAASGADWVGVFLGVNDMSRTARLSARVASRLDAQMAEAVAEAKALGLSVRFTVEDGSRTEDDALIDAFALALDEGADRICFADTVGVLTPDQTAARVARIRGALPGSALELHLHDDRGLALANALAGAAAGASWISTSLNGVGERAGVVDTLQLLVNMRIDAPDARAYPNGAAMAAARDAMAGATGRAVPPGRACAGADVFAHASALHRKAVAKDPKTYEAFDPSWIGARHRLAEDAGSGASPSPRRNVCRAETAGACAENRRPAEAIIGIAADRGAA